MLEHGLDIILLATGGGPHQTSAGKDRKPGMGVQGRHGPARRPGHCVHRPGQCAPLSSVAPATAPGPYRPARLVFLTGNGQDRITGHDAYAQGLLDMTLKTIGGTEQPHLLLHGNVNFKGRFHSLSSRPNPPNGHESSKGIHKRGREQGRIQDVQHPAEAGHGRGRVLGLGVPLEHRLGQVS